MAGFNFQTQTIINSNVDPNSGVDVALFDKKGEVFVDGEKITNVIRIKRDFTFIPEYVKSVHKRAGHNAEPCEATLDLNKVLTAIKPAAGETKYCNLEVYVSVVGAEYFMYSNPYAQKGKPFWVEFTVTADDTAPTLAKKVVDLFTQNGIFVLDKPSITVALEENKESGIVKFTGNMEYLRFGDIKLRVFDMYSGDTTKVASLNKDAEKAATAAINLTKEGVNGFGTYSHIVKDLRLPTAANTSWTALRSVETPIVGALYTQFIVEYCAPSPNYGMQAVGQKMTSHTTHVFWVKSDVAAQFEALFTEVIDVDSLGAEAASDELDS